MGKIEDLREFTVPSETLEKERAKGLKKKTPYKIIDVKKISSTDPSSLLQSMRGHYLLQKLADTAKEKFESTDVPKPDMFSACNLSYDGVIQNGQIVNKMIKDLTKLKEPSLDAYTDLMSPLGNMIIGHKILKHYCHEFIEPNKLGEIQDYYSKVKQEIEVLDESLVDEPKTYHTDLTHIKRAHGVKEFAKVHQPPILYNIEGRGVRFVDLFTIDQLIAQYEAKHWGKSAIWQGAKTKAFEKWIDQYKG